MLSVIIPCYNEEKLVKKTFTEVLKSIKICKIKKYEIIFIDDGSSDKSLEIVKKNFKKIKNIRIYFNKKNLGIGHVFFKGIQLSKGNYLIQIPSDNSHKAREISKLLNFYNSNYDIVTTFYKDVVGRNYLRKLFTKLYTPFLNFIYGLNLPYYNGLTLYKNKLIKNLKIRNRNFSYQIEIFVKLFYTTKIKKKIISTVALDRKKGSKAFTMKNSIRVASSIRRIFVMSLFLRTSKFLNHSKNKSE